MIDLEHADFTRVRSLFQSYNHNLAVIFAVLEGNSPGQVFVNHPDHPTSAYLCVENAFHYAAGDPSDEAFVQALPGLIFDRLLPQAAEPELVLFSPSAAWHQRLEALLSPKGVITIHRKVFSFDPEKFAAQRDWRARIPSGFSMRAIDQALATRFPDFLPMLEPVTRRFGMCLMEGEVLASACTAVFVGSQQAEIDIHTEESYQGRGLGTLTASAFIEECLVRRLTPSWSCWPEREASWKLALRLGFEALPDVPALLWAEDL